MSGFNIIIVIINLNNNQTQKMFIGHNIVVREYCQYVCRKLAAIITSTPAINLLWFNFLGVRLRQAVDSRCCPGTWHGRILDSGSRREEKAPTLNTFAPVLSYVECPKILWRRLASSLLATQLHFVHFVTVCSYWPVTRFTNWLELSTGWPD
jgi:hypothetical protein